MPSAYISQALRLAREIGHYLKCGKIFTPLQVVVLLGYLTTSCGGENAGPTGPACFMHPGGRTFCKLSLAECREAAHKYRVNCTLPVVLWCPTGMDREDPTVCMLTREECADVFDQGCKVVEI